CSARDPSGCCRWRKEGRHAGCRWAFRAVPRESRHKGRTAPTGRVAWALKDPDSPSWKIRFWEGGPFSSGLFWRIPSDILPIVTDIVRPGPEGLQNQGARRGCQMAYFLIDSR